MFAVAVVRLIEASAELPPRDGTGIMGYRAGRELWSCVRQDVRPTPKGLEINEFFDFFHSCNTFSVHLEYAEFISSILVVSSEVVLSVNFNN